MELFRKILKRLPDSILVSMKKVYYFFLIRSGKFVSQEKEFSLLRMIIPEGAKVVDIGANVGHYTLLFSKLVGDKGRVLAFEPIPTTFNMLVSNVHFSRSENVTLINAAISDASKEVNFTIPEENLYQSHMDDEGDIRVMCFPLMTFLPKDWDLGFLKIDAEGCDENIIRNSIDTLNAYRPIVMAELNSKKANELISIFKDYCLKGVKGSHNKFFVPLEKLDSFPLQDSYE
ncbi:MAG: FkbM family methyltransferase [Marinobacter adhaerens]|uniref:FkbM family methyltransferase n=1 Tax=Marinobacter adhaerens TaxID=1033846 RepID=A0A844I3N4_9GAMM|nr:FkbM family methyltransferase [Marinobacter adhaerens]